MKVLRADDARTVRQMIREILDPQGIPCWKPNTKVRR